MISTRWSPLAASTGPNIAGCTWNVSQIISAYSVLQDSAAPGMPGSRWFSGDMALNRWVTWVAPASAPAMA